MNSLSFLRMSWYFFYFLPRQRTIISLSQVHELLVYVEMRLVWCRLFWLYSICFSLQRRSSAYFSCTSRLKSSFKTFIRSIGSFVLPPQDLYRLLCEKILVFYGVVGYISSCFCENILSFLASISLFFNCSARFFFFLMSQGLMSRSTISTMISRSTLRTSTQSEVQTTLYSYTLSSIIYSSPQTSPLLTTQKDFCLPYLWSLSVTSPSRMTKRWVGATPSSLRTALRVQRLDSEERRILSRRLRLTWLKIQIDWRKLILYLSSSYLKCPEKVMQNMFMGSWRRQQAAVALALSTYSLPYCIFSPKCCPSSICLQNLACQNQCFSQSLVRVYNATVPSRIQLKVLSPCSNTISPCYIFTSFMLSKMI